GRATVHVGDAAAAVAGAVTVDSGPAAPPRRGRGHVAASVEARVDEARTRGCGARSGIVAPVAGIYAQRLAVGIDRAAAAIAATAVAVQTRGTLPCEGRREAVRVVVRLDRAGERRAAGLVAGLARGRLGVRAVDVDRAAAAVADAV